MKFDINTVTESDYRMKLYHDTMVKFFKEDLELDNYWGPAQMCCFYLEYEYSPQKYKMILECQRGVITLDVKNQEGNTFSPWMIFQEARQQHSLYSDQDIYKLIGLTHKAIKEQTIIFLSNEKLAKLLSTVRW